MSHNSHCHSCLQANKLSESVDDYCVYFRSNRGYIANGTFTCSFISLFQNELNRAKPAKQILKTDEDDSNYFVLLKSFIRVDFSSVSLK